MVLARGACQMKTATGTVTMPAMMVASQAVTRKTASIRISATRGINAARMVSHRWPVGLRVCSNIAASAVELDFSFGAAKRRIAALYTSYSNGDCQRGFPGQPCPSTTRKSVNRHSPQRGRERRENRGIRPQTYHRGHRVCTESTEEA